MAGKATPAMIAARRARVVPLMVRIQQRTEVRGADECWPWMGGKDEEGYPKIMDKGKNLRVTRIILAQKLKRPLGKGEMALHKCDYPSCVNQSHLFPGTNIDNVKDCITKGRWRIASRGEKASGSKLKETDVLAIIKDARCQRIIANDYGVDRSLISQIKRRLIWRHLSI